MFIIINSFKHL